MNEMKIRRMRLKYKMTEETTCMWHNVIGLIL